MSSLNLTPIQKFYYNISVFLTGFSGFLGKVIAEKLIHSCDVKTIYVLMRSKGEKTAKMRCNEIISSKPFNFRPKTIENLSKIVPIEGDIKEPNLGMNDNDIALITNNVSVVIHCAANVRFNAAFRSQYLDNVCGAKNISNFCHKIINLKSCIFVSTAFSCNENLNDEKVYRKDEYQEIIKLMSYVDDDEIMKKVKTNHPNYYTLTKAISETLFEEERGTLTFAICRPPIIGPSLMEPISGWIDDFNGINGIMVAAKIGLLQTIDWNYHAILRSIPADYCANFIITSAWYIFEKRKGNLTVFNLVSNENALSWGEFFSIARHIEMKKPTIKMIRPLMKVPKNRKSQFVYKLEKWFYHEFLCFWYDFCLKCIGHKPFLLKAGTKLNMLLDLVNYFTVNEFNFTFKHYVDVINSMSEKDIEIFKCDLREVNWKQYISSSSLGYRKFLLKDFSSSTKAKLHFTLAKKSSSFS